MCEELIQDGNLLHNIIAHLGNFGKEEEGEEAGYTAESGSESAAVMQVSGWRESKVRETYYLATVPTVMPW